MRKHCLKAAAFAGIILNMTILLVLPGTVRGEKLNKIVIIQTMPVPACEAHLKWFQAQLGDMGYVNGRNMELTIIRAKGDRKLAEDGLKKALAEGKPDVVATIATLASQAAVKVLEGTGIPIFFFQVSSPIKAGLIKEIGKPSGTNVSGRVFGVPQKTMVETIMRLAGQIRSSRPIKFGLIHSTYPSSLGEAQALKNLESAVTGVKFLPYSIEYIKVPEGLPAMLDEVRKGIIELKEMADFWWEPQGPLGEVDSYTQLLLSESSVPIAKGQKISSVKRGALAQLTPNIEASGREAAKIVDAILKGAEVGSIPVLYPAKFDIGLNIVSALNLNIVVPPELLELAGDNVFR